MSRRSCCFNKEDNDQKSITARKKETINFMTNNLLVLQIYQRSCLTGYMRGYTQCRRIQPPLCVESLATKLPITIVPRLFLSPRAMAFCDTNYSSSVVTSFSSSSFRSCSALRRRSSSSLLDSCKSFSCSSALARRSTPPTITFFSKADSFSSRR